MLVITGRLCLRMWWREWRNLPTADLFHVLPTRVNQHPTSAPMWMDDGWCTDRILFSIHVPSQVHLFFVCPFSALISVFFYNFIFSPPPSQYFFFPWPFFKKNYLFITLFFWWNFIFSPPPARFFLFFSGNFSHPPHLLPSTIPH
jgi:hypothetical protein